MHGSDTEAARFFNLTAGTAEWNWKRRPTFKSRRLRRPRRPPTLAVRALRGTNTEICGFTRRAGAFIEQ